MKLVIEIDMDNAAFDGRESTETVRILEEFAHKVTCGDRFIEPGYTSYLHDSNGNRVGFARVEE